MINFFKSVTDTIASTNCLIAKISFNSFIKSIGGPFREVIERNKLRVSYTENYIYQYYKRNNYILYKTK